MTIVGAARTPQTQAATSKTVSPCQRVFMDFRCPCIANHTRFQSKRQILASLSDFVIRISFVPAQRDHLSFSSPHLVFSAQSSMFTPYAVGSRHLRRQARRRAPGNIL